MYDDPAATDPHSSYEINVCKGVNQIKVMKITIMAVDRVLTFSKRLKTNAKGKVHFYQAWFQSEQSCPRSLWCESVSIHRGGSGASPCGIFTCRAGCERHHWPCSPRCRRRSYQSQFPFPGHPSWWYELVTYWWPSLQHRQDGAVEQTKTQTKAVSGDDGLGSKCGCRPFPTNIYCTVFS